jgi:CheY-like chemotaxis protein
MDMNKLKIMLVEDEAVIALDIAGMLKSYGHHVTTVHSGEKAVEKYSSDNTINMIIMDINLGHGMNGLRAAGIITAKREVPIIFLTGYAEPDTIQHIRKISGYCHTLKKPGDFALISFIELASDRFQSAHDSALVPSNHFIY